LIEDHSTTVQQYSTQSKLVRGSWIFCQTKPMLSDYWHGLANGSRITDFWL